MSFLAVDTKKKSPAKKKNKKKQKKKPRKLTNYARCSRFMC